MKVLDVGRCRRNSGCREVSRKFWIEGGVTKILDVGRCHGNSGCREVSRKFWM